MLHADSEAFLRRLLQTPGPSGFETRPARLWRDQAALYGADVSTDPIGNSYAVFNPKGAVTVLMVGHLDEIGVIAQYIDDDGFISISSIGGWDAQVLVGQRIRFLSRDGDVVGVIGRKPIHLIKLKDRDTGVSVKDLWVDIGATSRSDAERLIAVGDAGVIDAQIVDLANRRIASRAIDNRVGAYTVLEAARRYAEKPGQARVVALAATLEEIGARGGGALAGARRMAPIMALVVDVTFATDDPDAPKKEWGLHKIGGGPVISRGGIISPVVFGLLTDAARKGNIAHTVQANPGVTGTDADAVAQAGSGVPVGLVSIPNRYMHSPNELVSLDDLDTTATLLAATASAVTEGTDFTRL
jgi:putative aminopeptidase FrvX